MSDTQRSETQQSSPEGAPVWIEIPATGEVATLKKFYEDLFPNWSFGAAPDQTPDETKIAHFQTVPNGLCGGIMKMPQGCKTQNQPMGIGPTIYHKVSDLEKTEQRVHELGGTTCLEKTYDGSHGHFMNFYDPQGNRFGVYQLAKKNAS